MKNKLLISNLLSYFLISFIILNFLQFKGENFESIYDIVAYEKFIAAGFIAIISIFFFYILSKYHSINNIFNIFLKNIVYFATINLIFFLILYLTKNFFFSVYLLLYFTIPLAIIAILSIPLFYLFNKFFSKSHK